MSNRKLVRRPEWDLQSGREADPSGEWRRFVLDQVGYDEAARDLAARRAMRRRAVRRFLCGVMLGLAVFALAFAAVFAARLWREGRFDPYLPHADEAIQTPPLLHRARAGPADVTERQDVHVIQRNPFAPPPRAAPPPADPDNDGPAQAEAAPDEDDA